MDGLDGPGSCVGTSSSTSTSLSTPALASSTSSSSAAAGCLGTSNGVNLTNGASTANGVNGTTTSRDSPAQLLLNCDHIVDSIIECCPLTTRATLLRVNRQMYDAAAPTLYHTVRVGGRALPRFFYLSPGAWSHDRGQAPTNGMAPENVHEHTRATEPGRRRRTTKAELLGTTTTLTLESHDGADCAAVSPAAECLTGLNILRIVATTETDGQLCLCYRSHCELLHVLRPRKLVIRNCTSTTRLPIDLRSPLPVSVDIAVVILPATAGEYYFADNEPSPYLAASLAGKFRLVPRLKIVFWDGFEGLGSRDSDFSILLAPEPGVPSTRRRRIVVDDLVPILQNAACTNHRPWPEVVVYGLETLTLKAGVSSALARMYGSLVNPEELVHYALSRSHHVLVASPWTGLKVPYRVPSIVWEDIETYEDSWEREGEINETD